VTVPIPDDEEWHEVNLTRSICSCGEEECEHIQCARNLENLFAPTDLEILADQAASVDGRQDTDEDDGEPEVNSYPEPNYDSDDSNASDQTWVPGLD
jgi:hypothetical protein